MLIFILLIILIRVNENKLVISTYSVSFFERQRLIFFYFIGQWFRFRQLSLTSSGTLTHTTVCYY